jgi:hypothetical protein
MMSDESYRADPPQPRVDRDQGEEVEKTSEDSEYLRQSRRAMYVVAALIGIAAAISLGYFFYQLYRYFATGGGIMPTTVAKSYIAGHLLHACGLGIVCWDLLKLANSIDASTGECRDDFAVRHRTFWRTTAVVIGLFAIYAGYEIGYVATRDPFVIFRPEFTSGYAKIDPSRIEFRRASEAQVPKWDLLKRHDREELFYVSPVAEVTGADIQHATVRIARVGLHDQGVEFNVVFTADGRKKIERLTKDHMAKPLAVLLDGELRAAPRVFVPISDAAQLSNVLSMEEAAQLIREGSER